MQGADRILGVSLFHVLKARRPFAYQSSAILRQNNDRYCNWREIISIVECGLALAGREIVRHWDVRAIGWLGSAARNALRFYSPHSSLLCSDADAMESLTVIRKWVTMCDCGIKYVIITDLSCQRLFRSLLVYGHLWTQDTSLARPLAPYLPR